MKNKILRKILIYAVSVLLVGGGVSGVMFYKNASEQAKLEDSYTEPLPVMTQEEIEELYAEHKKDTVYSEKIVKTEDSGTEQVRHEEPQNEETKNEETTNKERKNEKIENEEVKEAVTGEESAEASANGNENKEIGGVYEGCPVDFEGMWKVNSDVYAWITVPGTAIDYPILQHATDNTYYLNYNIDGSYGYPGCIYTENLNSKDFQDNNTVIYGHNMKNGSMFGGLHKFEDASFFENNSTVIIYTPQKQLNYTIFASYVYDDRHLLYSFDFADKAVYANYINDILNMRSMNANIRQDVSITSDSKIITLVTCMANQPSKRLLVQAVLQEG